LLLFFGAAFLLVTVYLIVTEGTLFLGHIPTIVPAVQGLIMVACGVLAFRRGRKIYDDIAS
jgi:hypothetical protein